MRKILFTLFTSLLTGVLVAQTPAIQVQKKGQGEAIFFLPGFTCPGSVWDETVSNLKSLYTTYQVSYAGFNGQAPIEMPWYDALKKELSSYIINNKIKGITLIGHSMGGTLALDLAADLPEGHIKKVVVVDGLPCMRAVMMPGVQPEQIQYKSPYNDQMLQMTEEAFLKNAQMFAKQMTLIESKQNQLTDFAIKSDRTTYVYGYTDLLKMDIRPSLSRIRIPVLILAASFPNKDMVEKTINSQFENLSTKTIEIVENSRHFIFFDQADLFYNRINSFLNK